MCLLAAGQTKRFAADHWDHEDQVWLGGEVSVDDLL
jgi:hypothetical protein